LNQKLIALSGPVAGTVFELAGETMTLGRDADNDITIDAQYVSRRHCEFAVVEGSCVVSDRGSHNGTAVNGVPVKERPLVNGDRVSIGGSHFLFSDPEAAVAELSPLELDDSAPPSGATLQLEARSAVYLHPRELDGSRAETGDTQKALRAILELVELLSTSTDETLPDRILNQIVAIVPAERSAVLAGSDPERLDVLTMRPTPFSVSRTVLTRVLSEKTALLSNEVSKESGAGASLLVSKVSSFLCLPLIVGESVTGAIYLDTADATVTFREDTLQLLMGFASVAATILDKARQLGRLRADNERLQEEDGLVHDMVGESPQLKSAQSIIARVAPTDTTVLIQGESGTGKELAARAIHTNSERRHQPLVKVDCTGLSENLLASELFGHEKGAFTGAVQRKKGKLEVAEGGTVFLDEVGELPLPLQSQLLRVLQDREFERVGGTRPISVDIRIVAATNRDLKHEVKESRFREDLFYRLNVVSLELPPLRKRASDIDLLTQFFVSEFSKRIKRPVLGVSEEARAILSRHDWPGNIRELSNTIERAVVLGMTELILPEDLPELLVETGASDPDGPARTFHDAIAARKRELILDAVSRASGSITEAGHLLGLHPNYLHRLISKLELRDAIKGL